MKIKRICSSKQLEPNCYWPPRKACFRCGGNAPVHAAWILNRTPEFVKRPVIKMYTRAAMRRAHVKHRESHVTSRYALSESLDHGMITTRLMMD